MAANPSQAPRVNQLLGQLASYYNVDDNASVDSISKQLHPASSTTATTNGHSRSAGSTGVPASSEDAKVARLGQVLNMVQSSQLLPMDPTKPSITEPAEVREAYGKYHVDATHTGGQDLRLFKKQQSGTSAGQSIGSLSPPSMKRLQSMAEEFQSRPADTSSASSVFTTDTTLAAGAQPVPLPLPDWMTNRTFLVGKVPVSSEIFSDSADAMRAQMFEDASLSRVPSDDQEAAIVEDLLSCLMGLQGTYVTIKHHSKQEVRHHVATISDETMDPSYAAVVEKILPLCECFADISYFTERRWHYEYGLVMHAFVSAVKKLLKNYLVSIAQMEHEHLNGQLPLQRLWYYIQAPLHGMSVVSHLVERVEALKLRGGPLLDFLRKEFAHRSGDPDSRMIIGFLLEIAARPYFAMIGDWIYDGIIKDTYNEFLVKENPRQKEKLIEDFTDDYWQQHYVLKPMEEIPSFLHSVAPTILTAGKYLNVIRECKQEINSPLEKTIVFSLVEREYSLKINEALKFASERLLLMLKQDYQLVERLRSVKHHMLMDYGDSTVHFLDIAWTELTKEYSTISKPKLDSLLELAIRSTSANSDPFKDDVVLELLPYTLVNQLNQLHRVGHAERVRLHTVPVTSGISAVAIDYDVRWPLSLVLNRKVLTQYQLLYRFFLQCKVVERQLSGVWLDHQSFKELDQRVFTTAYRLRQRMLQFIQNLLYYMFIEVVEPNHHLFMQAVEKATTLDELFQQHEKFLSLCLKECLLTDQHLAQTIEKIAVVCNIFSETCDRQFAETKLNRDEVEARLKAQAAAAGPSKGKPSSSSSSSGVSSVRDRYQERMRVVDELKKHARQVAEGHLRAFKDTEEHFDDQLNTMLERLHDTAVKHKDPTLANLIFRIDFNGFYEKRHGSLRGISSHQSAPVPLSYRSSATSDGDADAKSAVTTASSRATSATAPRSSAANAPVSMQTAAAPTSSIAIPRRTSSDDREDLSSLSVGSGSSAPQPWYAKEAVDARALHTRQPTALSTTVGASSGGAAGVSAGTSPHVNSGENTSAVSDLSQGRRRWAAAGTGVPAFAPMDASTVDTSRDVANESDASFNAGTRGTIGSAASGGFASRYSGILSGDTSFTGSSETLSPSAASGVPKPAWQASPSSDALSSANRSIAAIDASPIPMSNRASAASISGTAATVAPASEYRPGLLSSRYAGVSSAGGISSTASPLTAYSSAGTGSATTGYSAGSYEAVTPSRAAGTYGLSGTSGLRGSYGLSATTPSASGISSNINDLSINQSPAPLTSTLPSTSAYTSSYQPRSYSLSTNNTALGSGISLPSSSTTTTTAGTRSSGLTGVEARIDAARKAIAASQNLVGAASGSSSIGGAGSVYSGAGAGGFSGGGVGGGAK